VPLGGEIGAMERIQHDRAAREGHRRQQTGDARAQSRCGAATS
jgi:hypothetical protein